MDTSLKDQAVSKINQAQSVSVVVSPGTNLDGLASGLAIYLSLKKQGKVASIIAKAPTVGDARLLYGVGEIGKKGESKNLIIGVNGAIDNVDKVTYFLEGDVLKIVVHALPNSKGVKKEDLTFGSDYQASDLIIGVGLKSLENMNTENAQEQKIGPNAFLININKEKPDNKFAQIDIIDPHSPCLSQITASLLETLSLPIDEDIAFNLYTGIASATKMFSPNIAKPETLSTSAWLLKLGAGNSGLAQSINKLPSQDQPRETFSNSQMQEESIPNSQPAQTLDSQVRPTEETPIEMVEREKSDEQDWLKPPKIYRGSKSFDIES